MSSLLPKASIYFISGPCKTLNSGGKGKKKKQQPPCSGFYQLINQIENRKKIHCTSSYSTSLSFLTIPHTLDVYSTFSFCWIWFLIMLFQHFEWTCPILTTISMYLFWLPLPFPDEHFLFLHHFYSMLLHSELLYHFPVLSSACESSKGTQKETQGKSNELCLRSVLITDCSVTKKPWKESSASHPTYLTSRENEKWARRSSILWII